jgi:hypothetical protein
MNRPKTGGRALGTLNKVTREIKELACPYGPEALGALVEVMRSNDSPAAARIAAAREVLDRAYGKPAPGINPAGADDQMPILIDPDPDV